MRRSSFCAATDLRRLRPALALRGTSTYPRKELLTRSVLPGASTSTPKPSLTGRSYVLDPPIVMPHAVKLANVAPAMDALSCLHNALLSSPPRRGWGEHSLHPENRSRSREGPSVKAERSEPPGSLYRGERERQGRREALQRERSEHHLTPRAEGERHELLQCWPTGQLF